MATYTIPFSCRNGVRIPFRERTPIRMRATGGEPAEKLLLYPSGLGFGIHADSVVGNAEIQSGLAIYGEAFDFGVHVRCGDIQLGSGKTLLYTDPKTLGELDGMTLDGVPFE